ncbi:AbfB domain-containing protein [Actinoplanes teichomyceticus]|uniref:Alpha-L-arabinofuranosidase B-like protein n=1 Tax=Actinoplanes teichomyceticus TaxID=1867 RepID=A0A561VKS9_ACTTI|nr:AbfB domain-containing protein [Actinoplanes teichomyceticus]TWG12228.1 alpha-L-arabinofuranosidase B-like protein [Actinoplanes teichomyceticus]GIF14163.1 hypothetical protein Ate01nite_41950 [Actinoplanes teichomyceticus]
MTIYGRGGVDVRDRRRLHPGVLALAATAGVSTLAAVAYFALRSPAETPAATPATAAPVTPSAPAATPASSPAPATLSSGSWMISPADDKDSYLTADGEYAAMSDVATALTVVGGLADDSCFSFRNEDGEYLRHYDYRLRVDPPEDEDLFRQDATFCPDGDRSAAAFRLRSKNYPDHFVHRRDTELYIDEPTGDADFVAETSFTVRAS